MEKRSVFFFPTIALLLLNFSLFPIAKAKAQQTNIDTLNTRMDSLNKRRMLPSFLLWQNLNTNPLYPSQNPFSKRYSPFYLNEAKEQKIQVELDSVLKYRIQDQLDSTDVESGYVYDFEDFSKLQEFRIRQEYWRNRSRGM
ncbi:hypothetical protein, partial [Rhodonellum sp.]|uniref:hypothetical protein n=1 Tax=Rhodonellum sp. TaxID=2231180 RepID=UPI00271E3D5C